MKLFKAELTAEKPIESLVFGAAKLPVKWVCLSFEGTPYWLVGLKGKPIGKPPCWGPLKNGTPKSNLVVLKVSNCCSVFIFYLFRGDFGGVQTLFAH